MRNNQCRRLAILIVCASAVSASTYAVESKKDFPLWEGVESVTDYGKRVNLPATQTLELDNGVKLELVLIPAGKFMMGAPNAPFFGVTMLFFSGVVLFLLIFWKISRVNKEQRFQFSMQYLLILTCVASVFIWCCVRRYQGYIQWDYGSRADTKPAHEVTITSPYYLSKFSVTQEQYQVIMGVNPSQFVGNNNPVESVTWDNAQEFCKRLSERTKRSVRLPSEAEWEYACKAETIQTYHSEENEPAIGEVGWYIRNSNATTHPVGLKPANAFGLYDMRGNVMQWCQDWHIMTYYKGAEVNPKGPVKGDYRVFRGASWTDHPPCHATRRGGGPPMHVSNQVGIRIAIQPPQEIP